MCSDSLYETYAQPPTTTDDCKRIAQDFFDFWNLPHCVGVIDGKYAPLNNGSLYFNYKGYFSTVLMAICDVHYVFTFVDIGSYGSNYDSGIFRNSTIKKSFFNGKINLSPQDVTEECSSLEELPYFFVGDDAFPLQPWLLSPYPGHGLTEEQIIFNYRLSRARTLTKNAIGIFASR